MIGVITTQGLVRQEAPVWGDWHTAVGKECVQLGAGTTTVVPLQVLEEPKQRVDWQPVAMAFEDTLDEDSVDFLSVVSYRVLSNLERTAKILGQCDSWVEEVNDLRLGGAISDCVQDCVVVSVCGGEGVRLAIADHRDTLGCDDVVHCLSFLSFICFSE
jgi:hypothetical protein